MLTTRVINERIETRPSLRLRRGEVADGERIFRVFKYALADLTQRLGIASTDGLPRTAGRSRDRRRVGRDAFPL